MVLLYLEKGDVLKVCSKFILRLSLVPVHALIAKDIVKESKCRTVKSLENLTHFLLIL